MDLEHWTVQMDGNAQRIAALVRDVSREQARWRPDPESWSILEVVHHLLDEEKEDFRALLDVVLYYPQAPMPPIDPKGWVTERRYNEQDLEQTLQGYLAARQDSLAWLRELSSPDWAAGYEAPWGRLTAGDVYASWVAHDLMHLRQLVRLHGEYTIRRLQPHSVRYAGRW